MLELCSLLYCLSQCTTCTAAVNIYKMRWHEKCTNTEHRRQFGVQKPCFFHFVLFSFRFVFCVIKTIPFSFRSNAFNDILREQTAHAWQTSRQKDKHLSQFGTFKLFYLIHVFRCLFVSHIECKVVSAPLDVACKNYNNKQCIAAGLRTGTRQTHSIKFHTNGRRKYDYMVNSSNLP